VSWDSPALLPPHPPNSMKRLTLLLLCLLPFPAAARAAAPRLTASQELSQIEHVTERIRHLSQLHPVKVYFPSDKDFNSALSRNMQAANPESEIEIGQRESVLLGLLKKTDNMHDILFRGLGSRVLGFYDYFHRVLYVRSQSNRVFGVERYNIAHEYTHALQDQHYNLEKLMPDETQIKYRNSDAVSAHHALTEGDAVNTQTLFIYQTYSVKDIQGLIKYESQPQNEPPLPKAIEREFYFPYTTGVSFVKKLYDTGGMKAVDAAYRRLPSSTYEIMHPDAYLSHWQPASVRLHGTKGFSGWTQVDDDVFGAFGYNLFLWQYLSKSRADQVTDAYRGDRYIFLENGSRDAMLLKSVWTTSAAAGVARAAVISAIRARYAGARLAGSSGAVISDPDGGAYVRAKGTGLTVAFAPTAALAQQLGSSPTS